MEALALANRPAKDNIRCMSDTAIDKSEGNAPAPGDPPVTGALRFENSYAELPGHFFARLEPVDLSSPEIIRFNYELAEELGLEKLDPNSSKTARLLTGAAQPAGAGLIAQAYAGHQFGNFVPQLGDGRAALIGELIDKNGFRRDIQLKGSGRTPFSRGGDGKAALGPVIREYLISESMAAFGIPTTRSLAMAKTGEKVYRENVLPGAVLTRVAASHIRVGTFQYFAARRDEDAIKTLADYAIARHYPELRGAENPYLSLLDAVGDAHASLVAKWMMVGFIHGVMNTDNCTISGETIDYGPCAFMDQYDHNKVFSSIDQMGRYAYSNQASIAQWNLARFAETLVPLINEDEDKAIEAATASINRFTERFMYGWRTGMAAKMGFDDPTPEDDAMMRRFITMLHNRQADFTNTFRLLEGALEEGAQSDRLRELFAGEDGFETWLKDWRERASRAGKEKPAQIMRSANPVIIPRNHVVERVIEAAIVDNDFEPFDVFLAALRTPWEDGPDKTPFKSPPEAEEVVHQTFCGT